MLASLQFPLADSRAFIDADIGLLSRPTWPSLFPDYDFVRFFGSIRTRRLGGLNGWIAEHAICEANRAIRFRHLPKLSTVSLSVPFRRFYFDGLAVGKFEVGIASELSDKELLTKEDARSLIYLYLNLIVDVPSATGQGFVSCRLVQASKHLAKLYLAASTTTSETLRKNPQPWWVRAGPPLLFLVIDADEQISLPFRGRVVQVHRNLGLELAHCLVSYEGKSVPTWVLTLGTETNLKVARNLRICLLRLHAEHECLKLILQNILAKKLEVQPRSSASNTLQRYLNEATRRISRLGDQSVGLADLEVAELARISEDVINPGERDALLDSLRNIDVRRNIFNKVKDYVNQTIHVQEQIMGDNYVVAQAGAVGRESRAQDMNFEQVWNQAQSTLDLANLATDLRLLRSELIKTASDAEEYSTVGAIASAETAAEKQDGPGTLRFLAQVGKWGLDAATKIGTTVAATAIKKAWNLE